jgi:Hypervirulence associated proteins TUDOR domain
VARQRSPQSAAKKGVSKASSKTSTSNKGQGTSSIKQGDTVEWETSQGTTKGKVKQKISKSLKVEGYKVKASDNDPQFLVESDKTGKKAAHKAKALKKVKG